MKYWWDNLDDDEKMTAYALLGIVVVIIGITLFFAYPVKSKICRSENKEVNYAVF